MKQKLTIVANWKAHNSLHETRHWLAQCTDILNTPQFLHMPQESGLSIILCPPFPFLLPMKQRLSDWPFIHIGAQDISALPEGAYTGEVPASSLHEIATYSIIGHSERRIHRGEKEADIKKKIDQCTAQSITPILCVRGPGDILYPGATYVAYEPVEHIGTGTSDPITDVLTMKTSLNIPEHTAFLYGGSVTPEDCFPYLQNPHIDGLLVGKASLDPADFMQIVKIGTELLQQ